MSIYTNLKIFHFREKIKSLSNDSDDVLAPIHIRIKPTNACSHNCSYCAYRVDNLQLGKDMKIKDYLPKDKILEIIDDCIEMNVKAITFSGGGDPFCYKYLFDAAQKLAGSSIKFAALTNGSLLTGKTAETFAKNATWLRVSIDGWDNESYAKYRGVANNEFEKVLKNIKEFKQYQGSCFLGISIIVDKNNVTHLFELSEKLHQCGVDSIKISPCIISNNGKENNEYHDSIFDFVKKEIKKIKKHIGKEIEIFDSYHTQLETFQKKYTWCPYMQILPIIGADQNIYPCQDKAYNLDNGLVGSIHKQRFKDFWYSNKNKFFKINPKKNCNHHCVANGKNLMLLDYINADSKHLEFV